MKYIIVSGGIISGIGKGITASSIGLILKSAGYKITAIKIDPYLNIDAGTMSPYEHGECYVLSDGSEVDLDLGNYERFCGLKLSKKNSITSGQIYKKVLENERNGKYIGKTVQIIPHITDEIKRRILEGSGYKNQYDYCIIELGGTVGDIETFPYLECFRRMKSDNYDMTFVHLSKLFYTGSIFSEPKTKPTQENVKKLRSMGINPDILVLRCDANIPDKTYTKLKNTLGIKPEKIICNVNAARIYDVPEILLCQFVDKKVFGEKLEYDTLVKSQFKRVLRFCSLDNYSWQKKSIKVGIAGKYNGQDTYLSIVRALDHVSFEINHDVNITYIEFDPNYDLDLQLKSVDCVIIPGGFGSRLIDEKIYVAKYCRENKIPVLGICLGMHIMVIEYARSLKNEVTSSEWNDQKDLEPIIKLLPNQNGILGGTMKLGDQKSIIISDRMKKIYGSSSITERHRHRYELTKNDFHKYLRESKLKVSMTGKSFGKDVIDGIEMDEKEHPFYIGVQFHPELISRYYKPHPLFVKLCKSVRQK